MERNTWRLGARDRIPGNAHCIAIMAGAPDIEEEGTNGTRGKGVTYIAKVGSSGLENGMISSPSCQTSRNGP